MEGILALLMPVAIVGIVFYSRYRHRLLDIGNKAPASNELAAMREQNRLLEQRVQNLELIAEELDVHSRFRSLEQKAELDKKKLPPKSE